ncbi:AlpA family phage regulatory protein [Thiothrix unzii]|jgi:prophage regulatory protein|uniref:helix-turn-helix transcriptional regulator n=1 Tax=Thiothrix unzii TaxID=111769 RepID=UPI002A35CA1B|nr:AlpA family phage regulatory protein [Thiothrix unzii]MDX9987779.1 AlpA family phage regulatory protein [Thiothrix unzii]
MIQTTERALKLPEVVTITGLSRATVYRLEAKGAFPKRKRFGENSVRWLLSDVMTFINTRENGDKTSPSSVANTP